jgi:hypothetical protein
VKQRFANGTIVASAVGLFCACTVVIGDLPEGSSGTAGGGSGGEAGVAGSASGGLAGAAGVAGAAGAGNTGGSGGIAGGGGSGGVTGGTGGVSGAGGGACQSPPCDCDGDGYLDKGGSCGGDDCDDADNRAHPGQGEFYDSQSKGVGGFDFDCDGTPLPKFHVVNCGVGLLACPPPAQGDGYEAPVPSCGVEAMYVKCVMSGAVCVKQNTSPLKMPCK